jgi:hypothetical protein
MKIYLLTEKQLRNAIISWSDCPMQDVIDRLKPIELPSDEEIEESETDSPYDRIDEYNYGFIDGANWVKQFILNQNK